MDCINQFNEKNLVKGFYFSIKLDARDQVHQVNKFYINLSGVGSLLPVSL